MANFDTSTVATPQSTQNTGNNKALVTLTTLFFMWGFITCLNDILIPYLRGVFELSIFQSTLVQFAFFGAYFIGSVVYFLISTNFGDPIARIGYKSGIIAGLVVAALGCILFFPAAEFRSYGFFLAALFVLGLGLTLLQIASNPYVALLGTPETASSRLNLAQGFNSFGTTIAPVIGGYLIFEFFATESSSSADSVKVPYLGLAMGFLLLGVLIKTIKLPKMVAHEEIEKGAAALHYPHLVKGMLAIFFYVGAEVAIGSLLINYFGLPEIGGLEEAEASKYLAFYWGGAMIGRFLGALAMNAGISKEKRLLFMMAVFAGLYALITVLAGVSFQDSLYFVGYGVVNLLIFMAAKGIPGRTLAFFSVSCIVLLIAAVFLQGELAMWSVIAIGLFNSIMWSNIFTLSIAGLGKHTSQGSSLLVMAILGGALIPPLQGYVADLGGLQLSFLVPVLSYLYIFYYGFKGHQVVVRQE